VLGFVAIIVACSLQLLGFVLALLTYCAAEQVPGFGMRTYKKVGTDPELLACYQRYQQFCATLKLDWLFQLEVLAFGFLGFELWTWQWWLTATIQLPLSLAWLPWGLIAVRRESATLMMLLVVTACLQPSLYAAQMLSKDNVHGDTLQRAAIAELASSVHSLSVASGRLSFEDSLENCTMKLRTDVLGLGGAGGTSSIGLWFMYAMSFLTRMLSVTFAILVRRNFGRGLATRVFWRHTGDDAPPPLLSHTPSTLRNAGSYAEGSLHNASSVGSGGSSFLALGRVFSGTACLSSVPSGLPDDPVSGGGYVRGGGGAGCADPLLPLGVHRANSGEMQHMLTMGSTSSGTLESRGSSLRGTFDRYTWSAGEDPPTTPGATMERTTEAMNVAPMSDRVLVGVAADEAMQPACCSSSLPSVRHLERC